MNMVQKFAQKANSILACIKSGVSSSSREVIMPWYPAQMRLHLEYCVRFCAPPYKKERVFVERVVRNWNRLPRDVVVTVPEDV